VRIGRRERAARGVLSLHRIEREMEAHLIIELARVPAGARERAELMPESIEKRHALVRRAS
jgi:hypothetical protein